MTGGPLLKFLPSIDRYIFRLVTVPMAAVFAIAASLLVLDKMLRLFDFVAVEGGPVGVVFKMLVALVPEYASLAIPLGLLLGILLAFRKLATTSELDVFRAVGLGYGRLLRVPFAITAGADGGQCRAGILHPADQPVLLRADGIRAALGRVGRIDQGRRIHHAGRSHGAADRGKRR